MYFNEKLLQVWDKEQAVRPSVQQEGFQFAA